MKTHIKILSITTILVTVLAIISLPTTSNATVGGPTYIGPFTYNKANESIYYIVKSESGRGCPPELYGISLVDETISRVFSCDQGEQLSSGDYTQAVSVITNEISKITAGFKKLTPISLPKNTIQVDIDFVRSEALEGEPDWIIKRHFKATVYQHGSKIDEFSITGCNVDQPFTFAGYAIPGFEKKIILLSSGKSDCWEGGYISEGLHVLAGVSELDKAYAGNQYKTTQAPLIPSEHTLVVFEKDKVIKTTTDPTNSTLPVVENEDTNANKTYSPLLLGLITVIAVAVGIILGKVLFRKN